MKRLALAVATMIIAHASSPEASAARCVERSSQFPHANAACDPRPVIDRSSTNGLIAEFGDPSGARIPMDEARHPASRLEGMNPLVPARAETYFVRARAHFDSGELDRAIANYDAAIGLRPDAAGAYVNRGSAYARKGEYTRAAADFDTAIRLKPNLASAYLNRGIVSRKQGLMEWALRDFGRAYTLNLRPQWMVDMLERYKRLP